LNRTLRYLGRLRSFHRHLHQVLRSISVRSPRATPRGSGNLTTLKSPSAARFLCRFFYNFRILRNHTRITKGTPFRFDLNPRSFFFRYRPRGKIASYEDYNRLRLFFGGIKPEKFWQYSRKIRERRGRGDFTQVNAPFDLRLDYMVTKLGLVDDIFAAKRAIDRGRFLVNGKPIFENGYALRPFEWLTPADSDPYLLLTDYFFKIFRQRALYAKVHVLPRFIEFNLALFRFMLLPLFSRGDIARPYRTTSVHVGLGRTMPSRI